MNLVWENIFRRSNKKDDVRQALRSNILFSDLSDRELSLLSSLVHLRRYLADEHVFRQGEVGVGMYIVLRGRVDVYVSDPSPAIDSKREIFVTQLVSDDFFGELSLAEENGRRTANAVAREESHLIGFFKPDLTDILHRNPQMGLKIVCRLAEVLGRRLKETTEKVSELRRAIKESKEGADASFSQKTPGGT
jgi:CRP/FNR family cyclic AMP-dependent transcriptional regulator